MYFVLVLLFLMLYICSGEEVELDHVNQQDSTALHLACLQVTRSRGQRPLRV